MVQFLFHLAAIVLGIVGLMLLFVAPKRTIWAALTLGCGATGSSDGFGGTVLGLVIGGIGGLLVVGVLQLAYLAIRWFLGLFAPAAAPEVPKR